MDDDKIEPNVNSLKIWRFDELASTNDAAKSALKGERFQRCATPFPCVFVAERQSAGRGTNGRVWASWRGALTFSIAARWSDFNLTRRECPVLSIRVADAIAETTREITRRANVDLGTRLFVKEPNDVYCDGRKLSGVLIESPNPQDVVIGVGVNIFNRSTDAPNELRSSVVSLVEILQEERAEKYEELRRFFLSLCLAKILKRP